MSNQRKRLAKYKNKIQRYRGIFGEIRHDKQNRPEVLIKDIYPIYKNGKKVPLRSKDGPTDSKGQQIATDHAWIPMTQSLLEVGRELFNGDIIEFDAVVKSYKIVRDDILKQRENLWQSGLTQLNVVYRKYQRQKQRELTKARLVYNNSSQRAYWAYKKHLLTFNEMKTEQKRLKQVYHNLHEKLYTSMKAKQKRRIDTAQHKIAQTDLIDYSLEYLSQVTAVKRNKRFDPYRTMYDSNRLHDLKYTKFLAAHSMAASSGTLNTWQSEERNALIEII